MQQEKQTIETVSEDKAETWEDKFTEQFLSSESSASSGEILPLRILDALQDLEIKNSIGFLAFFNEIQLWKSQYDLERKSQENWLQQLTNECSRVHPLVYAVNSSLEKPDLKDEFKTLRKLCDEVKKKSQPFSFSPQWLQTFNILRSSHIQQRSELARYPTFHHCAWFEGMRGNNARRLLELIKFETYLNTVEISKLTINSIAQITILWAEKLLASPDPHKKIPAAASGLQSPASLFTPTKKRKRLETQAFSRQLTSTPSMLS